MQNDQFNHPYDILLEIEAWKYSELSASSKAESAAAIKNKES